MSQNLVTHICGVKPDHEHNSDGWMLTLKDGRLVEDTAENRKEYHEQCDGATSVCSICGHAAIDDAWTLP